MIQIRNVPPALHRRLKARAAEEGKTLSDYLLEEIAETAKLPTMKEFVARAALLAAIPEDAPSSAELIREDRDSR